ncbi:MAG: hypothetical protein ABR556_04335 [Pyrinomonadaceae bacterium]
MESNVSNSTDQQSFGADLPLAEPHFDEESTVLSARPVVPLEKVAAKVRLTRALVVGLMIAGAVVVGMLAASIYYSRLSGNPPNSLANTETIPSGVEARTTENDRPRDSSAEPAGASVDSDTSVEVRSVASTDEAPEMSTEAPKKPVARRVAVITFEPRGGEEDLGDNERREERREARREERQRRREMKRENQENKTSRDLLRIREIFEGPRKP